MSVTVALDTSTPTTAVGVRLADGTQCQSFDVPAAGGRPRHATAAIPLLEGLLAEYGCGWGEVSRVVVGIGPGGFTGVRVGIATAIGLSRGCRAELLGVNGLSALLSACEPATSAAAFLDARRGELFTAQSGDPFETACIKRDAAGMGLSSGTICVGDGALIERERLLSLGLIVPESDSPLHRLSALQLIELASAGLSTSSIEPIYVRAPDAIPTAERGEG